MQKRLRKSSQSLAFAVAAFALTVTSVQAFGNQEFLTKAGLSDEQVIAIQEARELSRVGELDAARDALLEAGIDQETLFELREAHRAYKHNQNHRNKQIADKLTTEQQDALQVAKAANDKKTVRAILTEAGIERPERNRFHKQSEY